MNETSVNDRNVALGRAADTTNVFLHDFVGKHLIIYFPFFWEFLRLILNCQAMSDVTWFKCTE